MAQNLDYLTLLANRYEELAKLGIERWKKAVVDIRSGSYGADNLVSDSLFFWTEWCLGWGVLAPFLGEPVLVFVSIKEGDDTAEVTVDVSVGPTGDPTASSLETLPPGKTIPAENVEAALLDGRTKLRVRLSGLSALGNSPVAGDRHGGWVQLENRPIARIDLNVIPA
jgi:hypothetical protein